MLVTTSRSTATPKQDFPRLAHRIMVLVNTFLQPGEFHDPYNFHVRRYTVVYDTSSKRLDLKSAWQLSKDDQALLTVGKLLQGHLTADLHEQEIQQLLQEKIPAQLAALS